VAGDRGTRGQVVPRILAGICLTAPFVALLWVSSYAKERPTFAGMPFFYWYPLMWVPLSVVLMIVAYLLLRRGSRS
jgi:FtsH-binding integral membrane protein